MTRPALLVMDVQRTVVGWIPDGEEYVTRLVDAVTAAREHGVPVIHVMVVHRDGHPEIRPDSHFFAHVLGTSTLTESDPGSAIHPAVAPRAGEPVLSKRFISPFQGADLDALLRAHQVDTLVLTGLGTSGVVLSAVRDGTERQYDMIVLSDGCDDVDDRVHRLLVDEVFPREARVTTIAEWVGQLTAAGPPVT